MDLSPDSTSKVNTIAPGAKSSKSGDPVTDITPVPPRVDELQGERRRKKEGKKNKKKKKNLC